MGKEIIDYEKLPKFERKSFQTFTKSVDESQGIVEHIVAVMGNVDSGNDRITPGAFQKTIFERGSRVKCLDQHSTDSVTRIVGKPLEMRELTAAELPIEVKTIAPDATGGLLVKTQYALGTQRGREIFELVKGGYASESSIGYDPITVEFVKDATPDGKGRTVRELREVRLWEYSNVIFGMNPATSTLSAKAAMRTEPDGEHPAGHYLVVEDPEKVTTWHMLVRNPDGTLNHRLMGAAWAALHGGYRGNRYEGPNRQEAIAELTRLYEREGMDTPKAGKEYTPNGITRLLGDVLQGSIHRVFTQMADDFYVGGLLSRDERILLSSAIGDALDAFTAKVPDELSRRPLGAGPVGYMSNPDDHENKAGRILAQRNADRLRMALEMLQEILSEIDMPEDGTGDTSDEEMEPDEDMACAPDERRKPRKAEAGPDNPPTTQRLLKLIEIEQAELTHLLEV